MEDAKTRLNELLEEARTFVYFQIGDKSPRGNLLNLTPGWTRFTIRTDALIQRLFGHEAEVYKQVHAALKMPLVGNGESNFLQVRNMLEGAISAAIALIADMPQQSGRASSPGTLSNRIFIVHGGDHVAKTELERFVLELGLQPIVLHRQPDEGQTIIEKFEKHSDVGYAFVILTPDDIGYSAADDSLDDGMRRKEKRARQNVILEFGYFVGRLGRDKVCCVYTGDVRLPSDMQGLIYKEFSKRIDEQFYSIRKELEVRGYKLL